MNISEHQLAAALDEIAEDIEQSDNAYQGYAHRSDDWLLAEAEWQIKLAFAKLLVLCEALNLPLLRAGVDETIRSASANFTAESQDPDGHAHLKWASSARLYHQSLVSIFLTGRSQTVTKNLEAIIRDSLYVIVDSNIYGSAPKNEADVHRRIQGIIKCVFPDLLEKPPLSKPIKNFEPDTGIPSIKTIIEYKFLSERNQVGPIADQILADTRGYISERWSAFLYVIYETERFKPELEWRQLLRECENADNVSVIVLSGSSIVAGSLQRRLGRIKKPVKKK